MLILLHIQWLWIAFLALAIISLVVLIAAVIANDKLREIERRNDDHYRFPGWDDVSDWELLTECKRRNLIDGEVTCDEWGDNTKEGYYKVHDSKDCEKIGWFTQWSFFIFIGALIAGFTFFALSIWSIREYERAERAAKGEKTEQPADSTHNDDSAVEAGVIGFIIGTAIK